MQAASSEPVARTEPRRLAAFVHADMAGYSRLIGQDDSGTFARLARLRQALIDPALARYGGRIANTAGDSLMMEFASVISAVRFAVEIQTRIPEFDDGAPPDRRVRFRMGIIIGTPSPTSRTCTAIASTSQPGSRRSARPVASASRLSFAITSRS